MARAARRTALAGGALAAALLLVAAPTPAGALRELREPSAGDPTGPLVALISLLAWALTAWLLVTVALTAGGHLPGVVGGSCRAAARRVAPATVRRTVELALGLSVVVGAVGVTPAAAAPGPAGPAPAAASLDWGAPAPAPTGEQQSPDLDWAAAPAPAPAASPAPAPAQADDVVVAPGDSLWAIAAQDLAARTGTEPSDAQVAQAWPTWWAANRDAVGDDPDLIQPGTRLDPPADPSADGSPS